MTTPPMGFAQAHDHDAHNGSDPPVILPYLRPDDLGAAALSMATTEQRFTALARLFELEGHTLAEVPAPHMRGPLSAWCWLVLTVNGVAPEYNRRSAEPTPFPLSHYGIDLGFSCVEVRRWVWFLA